MLDIDVIRADPEKIRDMLIKRNKTTERLDRLLEETHQREQPAQKDQERRLPGDREDA